MHVLQVELMEQQHQGQVYLAAPGVPIVPVVLGSSSPKNASILYNFESAAPFLRGLQENLDPTARTALETAVGPGAPSNLTPYILLSLSLV